MCNHYSTGSAVIPEMKTYTHAKPLTKFIALLTVSKHYEHPRRPSAGELWVAPTTGHCSASRRNCGHKYLRNPQAMTLSEKSPPLEVTCGTILFLEHTPNDTIPRWGQAWLPGAGLRVEGQESRLGYRKGRRGRHGYKRAGGCGRGYRKGGRRVPWVWNLDWRQMQ